MPLKSLSCVCASRRFDVGRTVVRRHKTFNRSFVMFMRKEVILACLAVLVASAAGAAKHILKDSPVAGGLCDGTVKSTSGYFSVSELVTKNYFFWFFESRVAPSSDPVVIWLTGGPGCSSQLALLQENGPCKVTEDGQSTTNNPYSWNSNANIMWVDQPG